MSNINKGFTLIEILLAIGIFAILTATVIVAVNPARQFGKAKDAQRWSDVNTLLNAVTQAAVDNKGVYPEGLDSSAGIYQMVGTAVTGCNISTCVGPGGSAVTVASSCLDFSVGASGTNKLVPNYLSAIPKDPKVGADTMTYYAIDKTADSRIVVTACQPEVETVISVTR